jgi:hypothetical protein
MGKQTEERQRCVCVCVCVCVCAHARSCACGGGEGEMKGKKSKNEEKNINSNIFYPTGEKSLIILMLFRHETSTFDKIQKPSNFVLYSIIRILHILLIKHDV